MIKLLLIPIFLLLQGCDFSSTLHKQIIKAQSHIKNREHEEATKIYEFILTKKLNDNIFVKINFQLGEIYSIYLNKPLLAIKKYDSVINNKKVLTWQVKALERKGEILYTYLKDFKKAEMAYKKLIDFKPRLDKYDFFEITYAKILLELNKFDKAISILKNINENNNHEYNVDSYFQLGMAYFYKREWDEAIQAWFEYIKRERMVDKIVRAKFLIANAYETNEKLKEAYNIYYTLLGEYPNTKVIKNRLESVYQRRVARKR